MRAGGCGRQIRQLLFVYAAVVVSALLLVGPAALAESSAPLVTALAGAGFGQWQWIVRVGSTFATLGVLLSLLADLRAAIGFSSFTVLLYYAVANISAYTLTEQERLYGRYLAVLGLSGCLVLAFTLPAGAVGLGSAVMLAGIPVYLAQRRRSL